MACVRLYKGRVDDVGVFCCCPRRSPVTEFWRLQGAGGVVLMSCMAVVV